MNIAEITAIEREVRLKSQAEKALGSSLNALLEGDKCCVARFNRDARAGLLDKMPAWTCPKCGCEYHPSMQGNIRQWICAPHVEIIKR